MTKISIIAAIGPNRELGNNNKLLWHIPEDFKHFKRITEGSAVIMGRKTYESIGKPLPNRLNIIVTRDTSFKVNGAIVCHSLKEAIKFAQQEISLRGVKRRSNPVNVELSVTGSPRSRVKRDSLAMTNNKEVFIIGGGQIYAQVIKYADKLYLTIVEGEYEADTFFPDYSAFKKIISEKPGESAEYKYRFVELER